MALPLDSDPTSPDHVRDRRTTNGAWMLVVVIMMFVALAIARSLG